MDTAKPATSSTTQPPANSAKPAPKPAVKATASPTPRPAAAVRVAPMNSRAIAASLVIAFLVGGLIAGAVPAWLFILIGLVVGALALYGLDRFGHSRG